MDAKAIGENFNQEIGCTHDDELLNCRTHPQHDKLKKETCQLSGFEKKMLSESGAALPENKMIPSKTRSTRDQTIPETENARQLPAGFER